MQRNNVWLYLILMQLGAAWRNFGVLAQLLAQLAELGVLAQLASWCSLAQFGVLVQLGEVWRLHAKVGVGWLWVLKQGRRWRENFFWLVWLASRRQIPNTIWELLT